MKRIIAFALALTMCLGMIVSVSAANPFTKKLALVKLIRAMFTKDENEYCIGELNDGVLTLYVSPKGKTGADGTEKSPYATIENARDAIRGIDKSTLNGIDVVIGSGTYHITFVISMNHCSFFFR